MPTHNNQFVIEKELFAYIMENCKESKKGREMEEYIALSIETHLFFSRIMKEHALFLEAGFPCKEKAWLQRADWLRSQFENLLSEVIRIGVGRVHECVLTSDELVTEFTLKAEQRTRNLSGISINTQLSMLEQNLCDGCGSDNRNTPELWRRVRQINERSLWLLDQLIDFKERILCQVRNGNLFTTNYPLLIEHILREAKLYRSTIENILNDTCVCYDDLLQTENFWNRIMMEHAWFIRGLLDPSEEELIATADGFAEDYRRLLEIAKKREELSLSELTQESLAETLDYRQFKTAGAKGILNCDIESIILPLLADHVLREANHYIRLLTCCHIDV